MATTNDLKNGLVLNLDGQLWSVVEFQHVKPGKGGAFVRTKLKNVLSGKVVDKTFNAGTKVDTATVDKRDMQYLYKDGDDYVFMDSSTYDQIHDRRGRRRRRRELPAREPGGHRRHARGHAALRRAADVGRARDHLHRARPAGRPLDRRHEAGDGRDRLRDPGAAVPRDRHQGQGRHPRRATTSAGSTTDPAAADARITAGATARKARKRALDVLFEADQRGLDAADVLAERVRRADPPVPEYAVEIVEGVIAHRERIDELLATYAAGLDGRPDAGGRPRVAAAVAPGSCSTTTRSRTPSPSTRPSSWRTQLSTDDSPAFVNGLLARLLAVKPTLTR